MIASSVDCEKLSARYNGRPARRRYYLRHVRYLRVPATEYRSNDIGSGRKTNSPSQMINRRGVNRPSHRSPVTRVILVAVGEIRAFTSGTGIADERTRRLRLHRSDVSCPRENDREFR